MRPETLTNQQVLEVWESSSRLSGLDRTSLVLVKATSAEPDALERLTLGRRDALLLHLRAVMFGPTLGLIHECPSCGESSELEISIADIEATGAQAQDQESWPFAIGEWQGRFRLPDATDLRAAAATGAVEPARYELLGRCVVEARRGDVVVDPVELPEDVVAELGERILLADPLLAIVVDLVCTECAQADKVTLDIGDILLREIDAAARGLLADVDRLARRYGWREDDILAMSTPRRGAYLSMED